MFMVIRSEDFAGTRSASPSDYDLWRCSKSFHVVIRSTAFLIRNASVLLLLADLGGMMGLLLGASVMTVCEVLDLLFYNGMVKFCKKKKQSTRVSSGQIIPSEKKEPL